MNSLSLLQAPDIRCRHCRRGIWQDDDGIWEHHNGAFLCPGQFTSAAPSSEADTDSSRVVSRRQHLMNADTAVRTVLVCLAPGPVTAELQVRTAPLRPTVRITTGPGTAAACQIANPAEVLLLQGGLAGKVMAQLDPAHEPPTIVVVRSSDPTVVPALLTSLSGLPFTTNDTKEANTLTSREIQILKLICDGASNAQIARHLESDASTVNHQARRIYQKLGAPNRAAAAAIAVRNGWVESANIAGMNR